MTRDDLFNINAGIVKTLIESTAKYAPKVSQLDMQMPLFCTCTASLARLESIIVEYS